MPDLTTLARIAGGLALAAVLHAVAAAGTGEDALRARNADIVARTPNTAGIFEVAANGDILHLQSGLRCPGAFPAVAFWHAEVFGPPNDGSDVGCDYGRNDAAGHPVSKLTIFATRMTHATLDDAFETYRGEVARSYPAARYTGPAIVVGPAGGAKPDARPFGAFRSAEYDVPVGGVHYCSDLVVAVRAGWVLEVRATYRTDAPADAHEAVAAVSDAAGPALALLAAVGSVGVKAPAVDTQRP